MEIKLAENYISPKITIFVPICTESDLLAGSPPTTLENGGQGGGEEGDAKQHTSYSLWDDESEE